jgi:predicted DNA-binding protein (MmcQ/YjbR family)
MNKKYWMTLLLNAEAPLGEIEDLIRASHALVQNKKKK